MLDRIKMGNNENDTMGMGMGPKPMNINARTNTRRRQAGGKRKLSPALKEWNMRVMTLYREMKKKNPKTRLMDAMRAAKKQGPVGKATRKSSRKSTRKH
jgi:hypothetical protein